MRKKKAGIKKERDGNRLGRSEKQTEKREEQEKERPRKGYLQLVHSPLLDI